MAKKICCVCNKNIGLLSTKAALSDGFVCSECLKNQASVAYPMQVRTLVNQ